VAPASDSRTQARFDQLAAMRPVELFAKGLIERAVRRSGLALGFSVLYHGIAAQAGDPRRQLVPPHGISVLDAQLRLLKERFHVVRSSELLDAVVLRRPGQRLPVSITFDDDLRSHAEHARPALHRHQLSATFFVNGASLDLPHAFWWERLQSAFDRGHTGWDSLLDLRLKDVTIQAVGAEIEALDTEARSRVALRLRELNGPDPPDAGLRRDDVRSLEACGFEIGFHTLRHDPLTLLDDAELTEALVLGRAEVEAVTGAPIRSIAYPHGLADPRVASAARQAGYDVGFTTIDAAIGRDSDRLLLGRFVPSLVSARAFSLQISRLLLRGAAHAWRNGVA
jgi:peptidoglycan/xylan/chitin deacetylase (PgdA/CDA1 family)